MTDEPRSNQGSNQSSKPGEYVTVEIYDQFYHLSGQDPEHIRELAACVDAKMRAVAAHGKTADSLRVAVLAALNLADELSQATSADVRLGHARAASLRLLLDEVLEARTEGTRDRGN
jgi:cell division protein ZapA